MKTTALLWDPESCYQEARDRSRLTADVIRQNLQELLANYCRTMTGKSPSEIGRLLAESNRRRLDATPDLAKYPELRGARELVEAEWRGVRDGAGLDDMQAAIYADWNFYYHRQMRGGLDEKARAHCSAVYFHTSDRGALAAFNLDVAPDTAFTPPEWPQTNEHLVCLSVSSGVFLDEESPEIFPAPVAKLVARYCRSTDEAVEMLTRYNHFWGPCNRLIADRKGRVAMIEKSACRIGVRMARDGFGFVTAMTAEHPEMHAFLEDRRNASLKARNMRPPCVDTAYWDTQDRRRAIMNRLIDEAKKAPTFENLRALMQYRGKDGMVADNGEVLFPGGPPCEHTVRICIWCLREGVTAWWARDHAKNIPSWERRMPDLRLENIPPWP
jgi:hypothetical protein